MDRLDLWDVRYDILDYAGQDYDNALFDLSFDRDFAPLLNLIEDPEDNLPENFNIDKKDLIFFLTRIRNGIDEWLKDNTEDVK